MRTREFLHEVMSLAWQFVKRNGYTMSEAMKVSWANLKLKGEMKKKIVKFYFKKVDGSVREAYGMEKPLNFDPFGHAELSLLAKI